jgi:hypothetical protein
MRSLILFARDGLQLSISLIPSTEIIDMRHCAQLVISKIKATQ